MPTIQFTRSPARVTLGEALGLAARYWTASWERWVLAVVAVGLTSGLATFLLGSSVMTQQALVDAMVPGSIDPAAVPALLAGPLAVAIVSLVADWFLYANAILGLRGGEMSLGRVLGAGLRVLLVALVLAPIGAFLVLAGVLLGAVGLGAMVVALPVLVYVGLRLLFWTYGLFDGRGIVDAAQASWAISRGAVLRLFGWQLALAALSLGVAALTGLAALVLRAAPAIPAAIASASTTAFQAWLVIVIAILYESQRLRSIEGTTLAAAWTEPTAAVPPSWGQPTTGPVPSPQVEPPAADEDSDHRADLPPPPPGAAS